MGISPPAKSSSSGTSVPRCSSSPTSVVAVGRTEAQTRDYADAFHLWLMYAQSAQPFRRMPSLATTRAHRWTPNELAVRERNRGRLICGTAPRVVAQLRDLARAYGTDEVMINLMMPAEPARRQAIDAIVEAMESVPAQDARAEREMSEAST